MNVNPNVVSSALPLSLAAETETATETETLAAVKPTMAESPRSEVPIIITSHAPDREQSYPSLGGGAEPALPMPMPMPMPLEQVYFHPTITTARMPATTALPIITTTAPLPAAFVVNNTGGVYYPPAPATIVTTTTAPADLLPQPVTHYDASTMMGLPYQQPLQQVVNHNIGYQPAAESTAREGPLTDSMSKFVARNIAEACLTVRPPIEEETSNEKDDNTQGATVLTPSAANGGGSADFKKEGHRSGGLHIPSFLRGRRSRRNSVSERTESADVMSSGSNSGDDLSDVEFDEELDKKLKEEVEKDLPLSITDLTKAERTNVRKVCLLYNPMSGNKRGRRVARKASRLIEREGVAVEMVRLSERGHAEQLCETMDFSGFDVVVGVGGDGTFHECINGMMKRSAAKGKQPAPLALIAAGTGNSFMHELRCFKLKSAVYHILRGVNYPIDICRLTFGDGSTCYSFNSIHWGIASKIMLTAERLRWMGSAMRYTTACFMEIVGGEKAQLAKVVVTDENDKEVEYNDKFIVAIANNIITASRGMKMAPEAKIDDGLIDLLLIKATSTLNLLDIFRRTYDGSHTDLPYVIYQKVKKFSITPYKESETGELEEIEEIIDVDGELKGCTPFTCEVLPQTLRIVL